MYFSKLIFIKRYQWLHREDKCKSQIYFRAHMDVCSVMSDYLWLRDYAHQAPLSMGFPQEEYRSGLPFPSPGDLLTLGSNLNLLNCRWILYCWVIWKAHAKADKHFLLLKWHPFEPIPIWRQLGECYLPLRIQCIFHTIFHWEFNCMGSIFQ